MFAVIGPVPVMETGEPYTTLYIGTGELEIADPVYARPRVEDVFEVMVKVPRAAVGGKRVTVSPIINPFVLTTGRLSGLETAAVVTFDADNCVTRVPAGIEYGIEPLIVKLGGELVVP
jgi:hypothetical protein